MPRISPKIEPRKRSTNPSPAARTAFESGHALFEDVRRGIHDTRVDVPEFLQREKIRGVLGIAELIRGRLVNRDGDRAGCGVRAPARMQR